jgi:hypothetical protein
MIMEWIELDKNNLPKVEVLAANFVPKTFGYKEKTIGFLSLKHDDVECENMYEILGGCSHYIDINKFDL